MCPLRTSTNNQMEFDSLVDAVISLFFFLAGDAKKICVSLESWRNRPWKRMSNRTVCIVRRGNCGDDGRKIDI